MMAATRELKVYVTDALWERMQSEMIDCQCTMNGWVRGAIMRELQRLTHQRLVRGEVEPVKQLLGQLDIESVQR
jgi:hypothetical protein